MNKEYAQYLLKKTACDYNLIAEEWARTRGKAWEELGFLGKHASAGEKILDLGCGSGRLYELFRDRSVDYCGADVSRKMIEMAGARYAGTRARFEVADALNLPFANNHFNKVFSIAALHHIPSKELQLQFLKEAKRVLKPGGMLFLTVWNLNIMKKWPIVLKHTFLKILGKSRMDFGDVFVPWGNVERYVHFFSKRGLGNLAEEAGFQLKEIGIMKRLRGKESNIYLIAEKPH